MCNNILNINILCINPINGPISYQHYLQFKNEEINAQTDEKIFPISLSACVPEPGFETRWFALRVIINYHIAFPLNGWIKEINCDCPESFI